METSSSYVVATDKRTSKPLTLMTWCLPLRSWHARTPKRSPMGADADVDAEVVEIAIDRCPTKPLHALKMGLDLEDPDAVASFLEAVAKSIREKRRIILIIE